MSGCFFNKIALKSDEIFFKLSQATSIGDNSKLWQLSMTIRFSTYGKVNFAETQLQTYQKPLKKYLG